MTSTENPQIEAVDLTSWLSEAPGEPRAATDELFAVPFAVMDERAVRLERLDALLAGHDYPFERMADDRWVGMPACRGFDYVRMEVTATDAAVRFCFDTGVRAPEGSVRELNKLFMLSNFTFRLAGFDALPAQGGPITFTFCLSDEALGLGADEDAWQTLRRCGEDEDDELPEEGAKLLETSLGLASGTVREFTPRFNAVIFGDASALDARRL